MIPPPALRTMVERIGARVTETPGSHAVYVSNPAVVAGLITQAARSASTKRQPSPDLTGRHHTVRQGAPLASCRTLLTLAGTLTPSPARDARHARGDLQQ